MFSYHINIPENGSCIERNVLNSIIIIWFISNVCILTINIYNQHNK